MAYSGLIIETAVHDNTLSSNASLLDSEYNSATTMMQRSTLNVKPVMMNWLVVLLPLLKFDDLYRTSRSLQRR